MRKLVRLSTLFEHAKNALPGVIDAAELAICRRNTLQLYLDLWVRLTRFWIIRSRNSDTTRPRMPCVLSRWGATVNSWELCKVCKVWRDTELYVPPRAKKFVNTGKVLRASGSHARYGFVLIFANGLAVGWRLTQVLTREDKVERIFILNVTGETP